MKYRAGTISHISELPLAPSGAAMAFA